MSRPQRSHDSVGRVSPAPKIIYHKCPREIEGDSIFRTIATYVAIWAATYHKSSFVIGVESGGKGGGKRALSD
jgi:hypothetical protein